MSTLFQTSLAATLEFAHKFVICAKAEEDASWFHISLTTGKFNDSTIIDTGLHMLVGLHVDVISFKQCRNDEWQEMKTIDFNTKIFLKQFNINITVDEENFHIGVNNEPCMYVKYSVPLNRLNTLKINGHLEYIKQMDHRKHFPKPWPPIQLAEDRVDFSNDQPMSFTAGHVMIIKAKLFGNPNGRFIIQLRNACDIDRQELHVSVRFDTKKFIRNSKITPAINNELEFGPEESDGVFPFQHFHKPFKLAIAFTATKFKIAKDGKFICDFNYRTPNVLKDIVGPKILGIDGAKVRVSSMDYVLLSDSQCNDFESYSRIKYT